MGRTVIWVTPNDRPELTSAAQSLSHFGFHVLPARAAAGVSASERLRVLPADVFPGIDELRVEYAADPCPTLILARSAQQASALCEFANDFDEIGLLDESPALIARRLTFLEARSGQSAESEALKRLRYLAEHDPLTNLLNRRAFFSRLGKVLEELLPGEVRGLVSLDLDNFKRLNDRFGHMAGDEVLHRVATLIQRDAAPTDLFGRVGGEEFVLLLARYDEQTLVSDTQKILDLLSGHEFVLQNEKVHVSASAGLVFLSARADPADLLRKADLAMYEAKRSGKNRLVTFERLQDDASAQDEDVYLRNFENVVRVVNERVADQITHMARRLLEAARRRANEDPVTGLKSRRYFEERIAREIESARKHKRALTIAMMDLDDFRDINKRFRWTSADRALQKFAQIAKSRVRLTDWVARWGGEEFLLVMPDAGLNTGSTAAERIRREVEQCSVESIDR